MFGLLVLSFDHWELLLELQEQHYLSWAQRSSLYNLGYLLSHSARLYQSPMICTRSNGPRSALSRAQCTWKSLGSLKSGRCFRTNLTHFTLTTGSVGNRCIRNAIFLVFFTTSTVKGTSNAVSPSSCLLFLCYRHIGLLVCVPKLTSQAVVTWYFGRAI